ncbi:hypothetical protein WR25_11065 isoform B [Diploscapter pachys]|uniref:Peptidase S54 rhomboid domain-containing protein n=1 Tax=Diploscapter pachys TaxID=2018661 RepID=A0A2A2L0W8_9BILA|nr:hypothetical protein WR25_11065 isoform A [Diploscapter pachys]PAV79791.1 hypothetical protein WR25_11065 isoform B [Diploscapter pachys]
MTCQLSGRPCCIQLQGLCRIATKEYCNFVNGYWHENATLCSQVDCFSDVCGMIPFFRRDHPNQLYRLFISLFVHAGLLHLAITVLVQLWLMRDLEALIGWKRMALLYFVSGIGGNLASAIFVPFNPEVGPSGSQLGILAALLVDVYHHRSFIAEPWKAIGWLLLVVFLLFLAGLIPWVDNWAHLFGFIFGLLITIVTFPYLDFNPEEKTPTEKSNENEEREIEREEASRRILKGLWRRRLAVTVSFVLMTSLLGILGYFFIWNVDMNCPFCEYFNCINIKRITGSDHFCDNSGQELTKWLPI